MKIYFILICLLILNVALDASSKQTLPVDLLNDTNDDTQAVQKLIDAMPEGGSLQIPAGTLILSAPLVIDRKNFAIFGVDANLTTLRFVHAGDGLVFNPAKPGLEACELPTSQSSSCKSGAAVRGTTSGKNEPPKVNLDRVRVEYIGAGFWKYGLKMESGEAIVVDCNFQGLNKGTDGTKALIDYSGKTGGGGRIQMVRSRLSGALKGVTVHKTDSEGQKFYDSIIENVSIGAERLTSEPTFQWMGCRISATHHSLYFSGVRDTAVSGCLLKVKDPEGKSIVLERRQTQHISFRGNIITGANILTVNSKDYSGKKSKLVDSVSLSGNYIANAVTAFNLSAPKTKVFPLEEYPAQHSKRFCKDSKFN